MDCLERLWSKIDIAECPKATSRPTDIGWESGSGFNERSRARCPPNGKRDFDALGFVWDPLFEQWEEGYRHLRTFVEEHGHCRMPRSYKSSDGYRLRVWVDVQRSMRSEMSAERKARLDALGFVWHQRFEQWEVGYSHLKIFVEEHGHCRVTLGYKSADGYRLGHWVNTARHDRSAMSAERKARTRCAWVRLGSTFRTMGRGLSPFKDFRGGTRTLRSSLQTQVVQRISTGAVGRKTTIEAERDVRRTESTTRCTRVRLGSTFRTMGRGPSLFKHLRGGTRTLPSS